MSTDQITVTSAELIAAHPEITAAAPGWADTIDADIDFDDISVLYERSFGSVEIGTAGRIRDGVVHFPNQPPAFVYFRENETGVTAADLRQFAAEFIAAADAMERDA
ncbi:hypothetical protein ACSS7Z_09935 [Microbacterium sp. A82]|uniref:hypothetical protein n=1 Tax=Microbacterium sp. A82 TaxID=3450452 RepID=UPI003F38A0E7